MISTDTAAIIREGQCLSAGANARFLNSGTTFDQIGFNETAGLFTAGAQVALDILDPRLHRAGGRVGRRLVLRRHKARGEVLFEGRITLLALVACRPLHAGDAPLLETLVKQLFYRRVQILAEIGGGLVEPRLGIVAQPPCLGAPPLRGAGLVFEPLVREFRLGGKDHVGIGLILLTQGRLG